MKNIYIYLLLLCMISLNSLQAQHEIILTERIHDQRFEKSEVAIPLFRLMHDSIEHILPGTGEKPVKFKVKLPKMNGCYDTAYSYIFFNGIENNPLKGSIAIIWGNYNQVQPTQLWMDMNCNLDFTDDGDPISIKKGFKYVDLIFSNSANTEGLYMTRLSKFNFANNSSYYFMLDKYFKNLYPTRKFLGPNYCYREQQLRTVGARTVIEGDSLCIGLYDGNGNGLYTDAEEDEILVGDYRAPFLSTLEEDGAIVFTEQKEYIFTRRGIKYKISDIDKTGKLLVITKISEGIAMGPASGTKLKFKFKNHKDQYIKLKKYRSKKVLLYFFYWDNPQLKEDTVALNEIHRKYGKKIKVIMLCYGKQPGLIKNYVQYGKINYICGISSKEINHICKVEQFPTTIFLKKRRKVKLPNTTPKEVLQFLDQNKL